MIRTPEEISRQLRIGRYARDPFLLSWNDILCSWEREIEAATIEKAVKAFDGDGSKESRGIIKILRALLAPKPQGTRGDGSCAYEFRRYLQGKSGRVCGQVEADHCPEMADEPHTCDHKGMVHHVFHRSSKIIRSVNGLLNKSERSASAKRASLARWGKREEVATAK